MASDPPPPYAPPETDKAGYYPPGGYYPQNPGYAPGYAPGYPPGAPPPPGFQVPLQPQPMTAQPMAPQQQQQQTIIVVTHPPAGVGNCPICRNGFIVEDFTCCGICLAILLFPIGIICCMLMRSRRCNRCGASI